MCSRRTAGSGWGCVCPDVTTCRGPHRRGRVDWHHLAGNEPVEQVTDRGEPLLDARRRELARAGLDLGGDDERWQAGRRYDDDVSEMSHLILRPRIASSSDGRSPLAHPFLICLVHGTLKLIIKLLNGFRC